MMVSPKLSLSIYIHIDNILKNRNIYIYIYIYNDLITDFSIEFIFGNKDNLLDGHPRVRE